MNPKGVADGQQVNIPALQYIISRKGQSLVTQANYWIFVSYLRFVKNKEEAKFRLSELERASFLEKLL